MELVGNKEDTMQKAEVLAIVLWPDANSAQLKIEGQDGARSRNVNGIVGAMKAAIISGGQTLLSMHTLTRSQSRTTTSRGCPISEVQGGILEPKRDSVMS